MRTNSPTDPISIPRSPFACEASVGGLSTRKDETAHFEAGATSLKPSAGLSVASIATIRFVCIAVAAALGISGITEASQTIERRRMSLGGSTEESNGHSSGASDVSGSGSVVVFESTASNIVAGVPGTYYEIYWRDVQGGQTFRVTQPAAGNQNGHSGSARVSADGRWVVFQSSSTVLDQIDSNNRSDVFIWDAVTRQTRLLSKAQGGPVGNSHSYEPDISGDGRFVVFRSEANNLVPGDWNGTIDIFLVDRTTYAVSIISRTSNEEGNGPSLQPCISDDGNFIAFSTLAYNLIPGDTNAKWDAVVYDRNNQTHLPVSNNPLLSMGNGDSFARDISADGAFVVFESVASNLVAGDTNATSDVFRWRRSNGNIVRASISHAGLQGNGPSVGGRCDASGMRIVFASDANALVPLDSNGLMDVFVRDIQQQSTTRISAGYAGNDANGQSDNPSISGDGRIVCLASGATNLVAMDQNNRHDIFAIGDLCSGASTYCVAKPNSNTCIPFICSEGQPSLSSVSGITVTAGRVLNQKSGIFFWGRAPASVPLYGGTRCVQNPVVRSPSQDSGGNPSINDCSGSYRFQFDQAYMNLHGLIPGDQVFGQFWSRDPFFVQPNNIGLTDGIEFTVTQ